MFVEPEPSYPGRRFPLASYGDVPLRLRARSAFLPDPLPALIELRPSTWRDLADAQEWLGRLDMAMVHMPIRAAVALMFQRLEARYSAVMDGVITSTREVFSAELPGATTPQVDPRVLRYERANAHGVAAMRAGRGLTLALWSELSAIVTGVPATDEILWQDRVTWSDGLSADHTARIPMSPGPELQEATEEWAAWVAEQAELPALATVILAQFQFELLLPFPNSAHLARLFPTLALTRAGILTDPVLPISGWLRSCAYQRSAVIGDVLRSGQLDRLMTFMATGIRMTCEEQVRRVTDMTR